MCIYHTGWLNLNLRYKYHTLAINAIQLQCQLYPCLNCLYIGHYREVIYLWKKWLVELVGVCLSVWVVSSGWFSLYKWRETTTMEGYIQQAGQHYTIMQQSIRLLRNSIHCQSLDNKESRLISDITFSFSKYRCLYFWWCAVVYEWSIKK